MEDYKSQFVEIHSKLDKLIELLPNWLSSKGFEPPDLVLVPSAQVADNVLQVFDEMPKLTLVDPNEKSSVCNIYIPSIDEPVEGFEQQSPLKLECLEVADNLFDESPSPPSIGLLEERNGNNDSTPLIVCVPPVFDPGRVTTENVCPKGSSIVEIGSTFTPPFVPSSISLKHVAATVLSNMPLQSLQQTSFISWSGNESIDESCMKHLLDQKEEIDCYSWGPVLHGREVGQPHFSTLRSVKVDYQLFDKVAKRFPVEQINVSGNNGNLVLPASFPRDSCFKYDASKAVLGISSSKMMFGGMRFGEMAVFMFDPGISSWHLKACACIYSGEIPYNLAVFICIGRVVMVVFDPGGGYWLCMGYDLVDTNGLKHIEMLNHGKLLHRVQELLTWQLMIAVCSNKVVENRVDSVFAFVNVLPNSILPSAEQPCVAYYIWCFLLNFVHPIMLYKVAGFFTGENFYLVRNRDEIDTSGSSIAVGNSKVYVIPASLSIRRDPFDLAKGALLPLVYTMLIEFSLLGNNNLGSQQRVTYNNSQLLDGFKPSQCRARRCSNIEHLDVGLINKIGNLFVTSVVHFKEMSSVPKYHSNFFYPAHWGVTKDCKPQMQVLVDHLSWAEEVLNKDDIGLPPAINFLMEMLKKGTQIVGMVTWRTKVHGHKMVDLAGATVLDNFVWDPGYSALFFYILEDKDVFERVGKWMILIDHAAGLTVTMPMFMNLGEDHIGLQQAGNFAFVIARSFQLGNRMKGSGTIKKYYEETLDLIWLPFTQHGSIPPIYSFMLSHLWVGYIRHDGSPGDCSYRHLKSLILHNTNKLFLVELVTMPMFMFFKNWCREVKVPDVFEVCKDEAVVNFEWKFQKLVSWAIKSDLSFVEVYLVRMLKVRDADEFTEYAMRILEHIVEYRNDRYSVWSKIVWGQIYTSWLSWLIEAAEYITVKFKRLLNPLKHEGTLLIMSKVKKEVGGLVMLYAAAMMFSFVLVILKNLVCDPGIVWACHFTTFRTRRLLRGRTCHDPRFKSNRYELLSVTDVICDVIALSIYRILYFRVSRALRAV